MAAMAEDLLVPYASGEYPNLVAFIAEHASQPGYDFGDEFEYGLDLVLDNTAQAVAAA